MWAKLLSVDQASDSPLLHTLPPPFPPSEGLNMQGERVKNSVVCVPSFHPGFRHIPIMPIPRGFSSSRSKTQEKEHSTELKQSVLFGKLKDKNTSCET